jgi:hypothetical protein
MNKEQKQAIEMIKSVYEDQCAEINGREYKYHKMSHEKRIQVFAFFSRIQNQIGTGDFSFLTDPGFKAVEKTIGDYVTFDDALINKRPTHWDEYPEDYIQFIITSLGVISYPFLKGKGIA